jgi:hypothetical protein
LIHCESEIACGKEVIVKVRFAWSATRESASS